MNWLLVEKTFHTLENIRREERTNTQIGHKYIEITLEEKVMRYAEESMLERYTQPASKALMSPEKK